MSNSSYLQNSIEVENPAKSIIPVGDYVLVKIIPVKLSSLATPFEDEKYKLKPLLAQVVSISPSVCPCFLHTGQYVLLDEFAFLVHILDPNTNEHFALVSKFDISAKSDKPINATPSFLEYSLPT
jgi:hypothetical protein